MTTTATPSSTNDQTTKEETPQIYGPKGTNPGGKWYPKGSKAVNASPCELLCLCLCCCECSVICMACCDLEDKKSYVYKDPKTDKLTSTSGSILPKTTPLGDPVEGEELATLQAEYRPYSATTNTMNRN